MKKKKLLVGKMERFKTFFVILLIVIFSGQMAVAQDYNLSIWDFSGPYTDSQDNMTLSYTLIQDAKGKVTGAGTFNDLTNGNDISIDVEIKGKVKGKDNIVTLKYKVKGKNADGNKLKDDISLELDEGILSLVGIEKRKICAKGAGCEKTEADVSRDVPNGMTGEAVLSIDATLDEKGKKLEGTGELILSNNDKYPLSVKGKYNSKKDETQLQIKGVEASTKGIKVKLKIDGESDNATFIKGKAFGQQLELTATNLTICVSGETQVCLCSDNTTAEQACNDIGSGWETCECDNKYSYWNDPETNLTWQDPQKDAYKIGDEAPGQPDAVRYCEELVLGGYDDWRLPDIDELRTLIRGHDTTITGGDCSLTEGTKKEAMFDEQCSAAAQYEGPGDGGCYWASELTGTCNKEDIADEFNKPLEFVSSTIATDDQFWAACILFDRGSISYNHIYSYADVRCVRDGPTTEEKCADGLSSSCNPEETQTCTTTDSTPGVQVCADDGSCWGPCEDTSFTLSPPINDVSETCDQVKLTINVPVEITDMAVIMGFLFQSETFTIPPQRPPDGGTDYNQVFDPVINLGTPLEMTIPACSYYRDRCIPSGDYRIWLTLLQSDGMPPWPQSGDYWIGPDDPPLTLQTGTQQIIQKEITLVPWE